MSREHTYRFNGHDRGLANQALTEVRAGTPMVELPVSLKGPLYREVGRLWAQIEREHPGWFKWLYVIQAGEDGPVKIGVSDNPAERLRTLQQANAEELRVLCCWSTLTTEEKDWHRQFAHARLRGEWFEPLPELIAEATMIGDWYMEWDSPRR